MCGGGGGILAPIAAAVAPITNVIKQTADSVVKVVTDPAHANLGDFASVALPGIGGTIVNDVKHPTDTIGQAAVVGSLLGGAALAGAAPFASSGVSVAGSTAAGAVDASFVGPVLPAGASVFGGGAPLAAVAPTFDAGAGLGITPLSSLGPIASVSPYVTPAAAGSSGFLGSLASGLGNAASATVSGAESIIKGALAPIAANSIIGGLLNRGAQPKAGPGGAAAGSLLQTLVPGPSGGSTTIDLSIPGGSSGAGGNASSGATGTPGNLQDPLTSLLSGVTGGTPGSSWTDFLSSLNPFASTQAAPVGAGSGVGQGSTTGVAAQSVAVGSNYSTYFVITAVIGVIYFLLKRGKK